MTTELDTERDVYLENLITLRQRATVVRDRATHSLNQAVSLINDLDAAWDEATRDTDLTRPCIWTVTGRDGQGKLFKTCTTHGETKVVPE